MNPEDLKLVVFAGHPDPASMLRMAVRGAGVREIATASTPEDTVKAINDIKADALLVHVGMEDNDPGPRMVRFIRRWDGSPNPRIPLVAASSRRDVGVVQALRQAGVHELVVLPASGEELFRKLTAAINSTREFLTLANFVGPCRRRRVDPAYTGPERRSAAS